MIAGDNMEIKEIVSKIEQSTIMATDLIHRVPLKIKQPGEVIDLFEESKNILEIIELIKPESIKIYYSGEEKKYCSLISSTGFNQILLNLIYNALEAIREEGSIELSFDSIHITDKEKIRIYGLKNQDFVHIKIRDTGIGIEETSMREIFKPFYTTKQGGHSGLGLSMVLEIVENNNGFIEISSKRFKGTDVNVYLPQYSCEEKQLIPDIGGHGKKRVDSMLIIEDNEIVSSFIDSILNSLHINHYITNDPHEGILYMQKNRNSISHVYLDFNIKGISIIDLFNKLFSANGNAKFIISSGYFEKEKLHALLELNNDIMILKKPFDYSAFIKAMQYN
jgi:CheY-like chemotaxis protein